MATAVQTTITNEPAIGVPGMIYDSGHKDVLSIIASEDIPFGSYVKIAGQYGELPDSSGEVTAGDGGIALLDQSKVSEGGYKAGDIMAVMVEGRVWVYCEEAIANQAQPFIRFTANTGPTRPQGGFLNGADTAKAVQRRGVTMYRAGAAAGLGVVQVNTHQPGA